MRGSWARRLAGAAAVLLAGLTSGCLVEIDRVADPGAAFAQARREAARFQGRPGPARQVNVLVYGHDDGQLVRVCVPMWLARRVARHEGNLDVDLGGDRRAEEKAEERVKRHVRLEDIEKAGLGILVEVEEDAGDRVLVWLK
jgi:hypothetical protein